MLRDVIWSEDVIGEAARHHHLAGVELKAGVPEPGSELQVGAAHPGAGLLLQVHLGQPLSCCPMLGTLSPSKTTQLLPMSGAATCSEGFVRVF